MSATHLDTIPHHPLDPHTISPLLAAFRSAHQLTRRPACGSALQTNSIDAESDRSSLTSLTSSVLKGRMEGGRTYAVYGKEGG